VRTIVLVRHAATAWNENGYCQGLKDVPLSPRGERQVALLREALAPYAFAHAYASPLDRTQQTARLLGREPAVWDDLRELDRGHWEGHAMDEVRRRWGKLAKSWYEDPTGLSMPGGEAFDALWERAGGVLARLEGAAGDPLLVCGHKALNRVLLARALGRPARGVWDIPQPQACYSVLRGEAGRWSADPIGAVDHLPDDLRSDS
jgi:broad specificity phosphatase PhoE